MLESAQEIDRTSREPVLGLRGASCTGTATGSARPPAPAGLVGALVAAALAALAACGTPGGASRADLAGFEELERVPPQAAESRAAEPQSAEPDSSAVLPWLLNEEWERLGLLETHPVTRARLVLWCGWPIRLVALDQGSDAALVHGPRAVVGLRRSRGTWSTREPWIAPMYGEIVDCASGTGGTVAAVLRYPQPAAVGYRFPPEIDAGQLGFGSSGPSTCWDVVAGRSSLLRGDGGVGLRMASLLTEPLLVEPRIESVSDRQLVLTREDGRRSSLPMMRAAQLAEDWPTFTPSWVP